MGKITKMARTRTRMLTKSSDISDFKLQVITFSIASLLFQFIACGTLIAALTSTEFYIVNPLYGKGTAFDLDEEFMNTSAFLRRYCTKPPISIFDQNPVDPERTICNADMATYELFAFVFLLTGFFSTLTGIIHVLGLTLRVYDFDLFSCIRYHRYKSNVFILNVLIGSTYISTYTYALGNYIIYVFTPTRVPSESAHVYFFDGLEHTIKIKLGTTFLYLYGPPSASGLSFIFSMLLTVYHKEMVPVNL